MDDRAELIRRLRIKADMIAMGEKIEWGSDSAVMREAADALETAVPEPTEETIRYVSRYGGRCRNCADNFGVCEASGLPCDPDEQKRAIRHVLNAVSYGVKHGYLAAAPEAPGQFSGYGEFTPISVGADTKADTSPPSSPAAEPVAPNDPCGLCGRSSS